MMVNKSRIIQNLIIVVLLFFFISAGYSFHTIFKNVQNISEKAKSEFGSDHVEALIALMESENFSFKDRNRAIWALGQIGDKRALPHLTKLNTKVPSQAKPWNSGKYLVKFSIEKAVKQIKSKFIVTRWMYQFV